MRPVSVVLMCISLSACAAVKPSRGDRPNIILVLTDDQGYGDIGIHGNEKIRTPNLDRFAREGIEFTRFYCSPVCAPTRAALMTGRYFYRTGVIHTSRGGAKMHGDEVTVAEILLKEGYRTGIFGKWHLGDSYPMRPQDQGFERVLIHKSGGIDQGPDHPSSYFNPRLWKNGTPHPTTGYCTDVFFNAAMAFAEEHRTEPFFIYLPTNAPHTPLDVSDQYAEPYRNMGLNDTTARVYGMVENIDDNIGRLLDRLETLDLRNNTVVFFIADNGAQQERFNAGLKRRKGWVYEGGIRVLSFAQWPGRWKGGRKIDRIAAHLDLLPTLSELAGIDARDFPVDGRSLVPLLEGRADPWPDRTLYFQVHRGLTPRKFQNCAAVTQTTKMIGYPGTFGREDLEPNARRPVLELYDLSKDPGEKRNLAREKPDLLKRLQSGYAAWFEDVKASRGFQPGWIHLGSDHENPVRLSRYQDGSYRGGVPHGWEVVVERPGRYEVTIHRGDRTGPARLGVRWNGRTITRPISKESPSAVFDLDTGRGVIDIWFQEEGKEREIFWKNDPVGDADVRRLD